MIASRSNDLSLADTWHLVYFTGKNNGFPFLDILGYLNNTHKNPNYVPVLIYFMTPIKHLSIAYQGINLRRLLRFFFLSKAPHVGSGFGEQGDTPPPRIPRSTPPGSKWVSFRLVT